jgi:hypothetical protein
MSIIAGLIIIAAGIGTYYVLSSDGYTNPGISIVSFNSTSDVFMPASGSNTLPPEVPEFYAHVDSDKTAEYELRVNGHMVSSGVVTGRENITLPDSLSQYSQIASLLSSPGIHVATFSILYNFFNESRTLNIFTFPVENFSVSHYYIDVGIADPIAASNDNYNISINGHSGGSYTFVPSSPGDFNLTYNLSYKDYHFTGLAAEIHVFRKPVPTAIYYTNYSYCSFVNTSCFILHMNETGGDILSSDYSQLPLNYSIYVNDTFYTNVSNYGYYSFSIVYEYEGNISYRMSLSGSGPFYVYFKIGDRYYDDATSEVIEVP